MLQGGAGPVALRPAAAEENLSGSGYRFIAGHHIS
jgi:hypothetical protein